MRTTHNQLTGLWEYNVCPKFICKLLLHSELKTGFYVCVWGGGGGYFVLLIYFTKVCIQITRVCMQMISSVLPWSPWLECTKLFDRRDGFSNIFWASFKQWEVAVPMWITTSVSIKFRNCRNGHLTKSQQTPLVVTWSVTLLCPKQAHFATVSLKKYTHWQSSKGIRPSLQLSPTPTTTPLGRFNCKPPSNHLLHC